MYNTFSFTFVLFTEPITFLLCSLSMQALQKIGFKIGITQCNNDSKPEKEKTFMQ